MGTVRLHRVIKSSPEKIYRAFVEPAALARWIPPYGFIGTVHEMDAKVGGSFRMSFTNFGTGKSESFGGTFLELVPGERIRHTDKFEDANMPGELLVTIDLKQVLCGTEIHIVQENLPEAIPLEFCYLGWQESLEQLAHLVEPVIPDAP
jgi:uncharacterized protein YndB with AHSA1/START domain